MKGKIYQSCVRLAILYGSEMCLRENEMAILRRTKKATMRAMCRVKILEERSQELAGFKGYSGWTSLSDWSMMVWACFEEG